METVQGRLPSFRVVDMPPDRRRSSPFNVDKEKLMQLTKNKDKDILQELGGVAGIILSLNTHASYGIRGDAADLARRINLFESNHCTTRGVVRRYLWAVSDRLIQDWFYYLAICSVFLIVAGIKLNGRTDGWKDGVYCLVFILVFPVISAIIGQVVGDYFDKVMKGSQLVIVLRNGLKQLIPVSSILVGDIALLKKGDVIPGDGLLLDAYGDQPLKVYCTGEIVEVNHSDPFLNSGAKVVQGRARMMITRAAKGKNFLCGYDKTKLGAQINYLIRLLEVMKCLLAISSFLISVSRYFSRTAKDDNGYTLFNHGTTSTLEVSYMIGEYIITASTIFVAMDTTNFSWALKICFAHAINVMAGCNVMVGNLSSWEKIGLGVATVNVIDEFNSSNQLITSNFLFVPQITENKKASSCVAPNVLELIQQGIGLNMTGISNHGQRCKLKFLGSPRERAFVSQAGLESGKGWERLMNECAVIRVETLENQGRLTLVKRDYSFLEHRRGPAEMTLSLCSDYYDDMGVLRSLDDHTRGLIGQRLQSMNSDGRTQVIALAYRRVPDQELKDDSLLEEEEGCYYLLGFVVLKELNQDGIMQDVVQKYRDTGMNLNIFHEENLGSGIAGAAAAEPEERGTNQVLENEISATGTTAGEDIMECEGGNGSKETTENCTELANNQKNFGSAEVVREVAQNNQNEDLDNGADSIESGETESNQISDELISAKGGLAGQQDIIQSKEENNESKEETECSKEVVSLSASDDSITLQHIPNATDDVAPVEEEVTSLSEATISISMGIKGDETRDSDIVILDEKITTLPLILMWAKCMLLNTQAFTQFQLTVMITSLANAFISLVQPLETSGVNRSLACELVQQIWVNTVMGLIGTLTFGRQRPQHSITLPQKPPEEEKIWLVTEYMLRNIVTQSVYQITVVSMLHYKGAIFGFTDGEKETTTFVVPILLQVFNMINARKIEEKNIFSGVRPRFIWLIAALMIASFVWVEILARIVDLERMGATQWGICIAIALVAWPVGFAAKFVPVGFFFVPVHLVAAVITAVVNRLKWWSYGGSCVKVHKKV